MWFRLSSQEARHINRDLGCFRPYRGAGAGRGSFLTLAQAPCGFVGPDGFGTMWTCAQGWPTGTPGTKANMGRAGSDSFDSEDELAPRLWPE